MFSAYVICLVILWIPLAASRAGREPECSRFHYEEQLLEKMVRMEFNMERVQERVDALQETTRNTPAIIDQRISEAISKTEVKDNKEKRVFGSVYTRWGRSTCPTGSVYLYDGFVAGGRYDQTGGGVNYLCLPKDPIWAEGNPTASTTSLIEGTEYQIDASIWKHLHDHDAPCAVCQADGPIMMIPARTVCYDGWRLEYHGYLMTTYHTHVGSKEYVCVDAEATTAQGSNAASHDGALFYFVKPSCGALKCPPYDNNKLLTCAVCMRAQ